MIWFREMFGLIRQYRQANRDYRWAMKQLKKQVKEQAQRQYKYGFESPKPLHCKPCRDLYGDEAYPEA